MSSRVFWSCEPHSIDSVEDHLRPLRWRMRLEPFPVLRSVLDTFQFFFHIRGKHLRCFFGSPKICIPLGDKRLGILSSRNRINYLQNKKYKRGGVGVLSPTVPTATFYLSYKQIKRFYTGGRRWGGLQ